MPFNGTDLSEIDTDQPLDTELVSALGSALKETRTAVVASFGEEHDLGGAHDILYTTVGSLPAAGKAGRVAFVNGPDFDYVVVDNGSAWVAQEIGENTWKSLGGIRAVVGSPVTGSSWLGVRSSGDVLKVAQDDPQAMWREYLIDGVTYDLELYCSVGSVGAAVVGVELVYEGASEDTTAVVHIGTNVTTVRLPSSGTNEITASGTGWKTFSVELTSASFGVDTLLQSTDYCYLAGLSYRLTRQLP